MTKKHFEALALVIVGLCERVRDSKVDADRLRDLLISELGSFCYSQNNRFDWQRFQSRIEQLMNE